MKKVLFAILIILSVCLCSQEPLELTIDDAIKMALDNNTALQISSQEVKQYRAKLFQNLGFLPLVTLQGYKNIDEKLMSIEMPALYPGMEPSRFELDFTKNYEFTLQVVQPIFTGGKILYTVKNAQLDLKIAKEKQRNSRDETVLNVKKAFYSIQILNELMKAHQEVLELAENNYRNVQQSFELGVASQYDRLRAELAVSAIKPELLRTENLLQTSLQNLKMLLQIPESRPVNLKGELGYSLYQVELARLLSSALSNRSEILQLEMEKKKINNLLRITLAQYIPDFGLVASYSYRSDLFNFRKNNWEDYYTINLGVNFTVLSGLKKSAQVGEMKVLQKILDLGLKQLSDATRLEVANKYRAISQEYETIQLGLKSVASAKEGVRIAELNYREGLITILELNASYNELTKARVNYLQALFNYHIAIAELEKISGFGLTGGDA